MQPVPLAADWFQGAISVELCDGWLKPWRLPHDRRNLFPSPNEDLLSRAEMASGARLRFATDSTRLVLRFLPLPGAVNPVCPRDTFRIDLTLNGNLLASADVKPGGEEAEFAALPRGEKVLELARKISAPVSQAWRTPSGHAAMSAGVAAARDAARPRIASASPSPALRKSVSSAWVSVQFGGVWLIG